MNLYEGIKENLKETDLGLIDYAQNYSIDDFITKSLYPYSDKIKYIAEQLEKFSNTNEYKDNLWNKYMLEVSTVLYDTANKINSIEKSTEFKKIIEDEYYDEDGD